MTQTNMLVSFCLCSLSPTLKKYIQYRVNVIDLVKFDRAQTQL